ncbi:hypothetical protein Leryth_013124 [Lithospermum erythrorhizon]|nr:hypothetical protein Leryth_013124 [Lithospermum erythrorhizon]
MLRKVSNSSTSKQELMASYGSLQSLSSSSLLGLPRLFSSFVSKSCPDSESMMSPTSILDSKSCSSFTNPFWSDTNSCKSPKQESKISRDKLDSRGVGLGLVDVLIQDDSDARIVKSDSKTVLFGSQLKIQIPHLTPSGVESPKSPPEFGIKTRNSYVGPFSPLLTPSPSKKSLFSSSNSSGNSPRVVSSISSSEMELSEEYTCVISHGANPRTTHIFDDCIVESCCGVSKLSESRKETPFSADHSLRFPSEDFLSSCNYCKKNLGQGVEIYMYRGEKAFCSSDCRYHEIELDEGIETPEFDDLYGTLL